MTLFLYLLYIISIPIFSLSHGLLVMYDLPNLTRSGFASGLMFGSAVVFVLLGSLMMSWAPQMTAGMASNLWTATYFFIWVDNVITLTTQSKSLKYSEVFGISFVFIYVFFFVLNFIKYQNSQTISVTSSENHWKIRIIIVWIWGWMCFYLGISGLLVFNSFHYFGYQIPLALGAMLLCFLNYLFYLYMEKTQGKEVEPISKIARIVFSLWFLVLITLWIIRKWRD